MPVGAEPRPTASVSGGSVTDAAPVLRTVNVTVRVAGPPSQARPAPPPLTRTPATARSRAGVADTARRCAGDRVGTPVTTSGTLRARPPVTGRAEMTQGQPMGGLTTVTIAVPRPLASMNVVAAAATAQSAEPRVPPLPHSSISTLDRKSVV